MPHFLSDKKEGTNDVKSIFAFSVRFVMNLTTRAGCIVNSYGYGISSLSNGISIVTESCSELVGSDSTTRLEEV